MELVHISDQPERSIYGSTGGQFELAAGHRIEIRTKTPGTEVALDETVPAGKAWAVRVHVEVVETEA